MYTDIINDIMRALSLRAPQAKALQLLDKILPDSIDNLTLDHVQAISQDMTDFHYDFPSLCFSIATGVGKTRLMGAMILYLYQSRGIRNFFVVAPNLTIYEKLKKDFSYGTPKYVFPGQTGFGGHNPIVIDGENYHQMGGFFGETHDKIVINIFNISKFNSTKETTKLRKISEYLGQSYFEYLQSLENLVVLMDESHRYKQDRSISALNELNPLLGLEFTATPYITTGNKTVKTSNILYEYSLASAISDGFVKRPAIATRKNLANTVSAETLELTKINDGIYIHEDTKLSLQAYAQNNNLPLVKPFMMINASDQKHADEIEALVTSDEFFSGRYKNKVLKIYSGLGGSDKDRAIKMLLDVERINNPIEIVIQVAMLKEGRDVNNLYTIVPLKAFTADILTEQTLGRGLRLPYGRITGDENVDRLTVVAHDRFEQLIDAANKPDSLIRDKIDMSIIDLDQERPDLTTPKQLIITTGQYDSSQELISKDPVQIQIQTLGIDQEQAQEVATSIINAQREVLQEIERINPTQSTDKTFIAQKVQEKLLTPKYHGTITQVFGSLDNPAQQAKFIETISYDLADQFLSRSIDLPRVVFDYPDVHISFDTTYKLNTTLFKQLLVADAPIIIRDLQSGQESKVVQAQLLSPYQGSVESCLMSTMLDIGISELDYDLYSEWLYDMAHDAVQAMRESYPDQDDHFFKNIIQVYYKDVIFNELARQIRSVKHYHQGTPVVTVYPGNKTIKSEALEALAQGGMRDFRNFSEPASTIGQYVFTGFKKGIARQCKFQSNKERIFAVILENESETQIQKWLKPPLDTLQIYYFDSDEIQRSYNPDFIVQTDTCTYLIETKATNMMGDEMVLKKKAAALQRVQAVNASGKFGIREYVLIPDELISESMTFDGILSRAKVV